MPFIHPLSKPLGHSIYHGRHSMIPRIRISLQEGLQTRGFQLVESGSTLLVRLSDMSCRDEALHFSFFKLPNVDLREPKLSMSPTPRQVFVNREA